MRVAVLAFPLALSFSSACVAGVEAPPPREAIAPRPNPSVRSVDDGIAAYRSERYAEAGRCFAELLAGRTASGKEGEREEAEFWLAKSYVKLEDHPRAIAGFAAIGREPASPYYELALPWLVHLRLRRPDDPLLNQAVGGYPLSILEHEGFGEVLDELRVAFAAHRLRSGDTEVAYALALAVPGGTDVHCEAQLIAGYASLRRGREAEAIDHFRSASVAPERERLSWRRRRQRRRTPPSVREVFYDSVRERARGELARRGVEAPSQSHPSSP